MVSVQTPNTFLWISASIECFLGSPCGEMRQSDCVRHKCGRRRLRAALNIFPESSSCLLHVTDPQHGPPPRVFVERVSDVSVARHSYMAFPSGSAWARPGQAHEWREPQTEINTALPHRARSRPANANCRRLLG